MKVIKIGFGVLAVAVFVSWFSFGTAYAQGPAFTDWEGRWLKINTNFKGYEHNPAGPPDWFTVNDRFTLFLYMGDSGMSWNGSRFTATFYYFDDEIGNWQWVSNVILNYLSGSPLDFLIWVENNGEVGVEGDIDRLAFGARISGKMNRTGDALQTASFKCLGGYFIEKDTSNQSDPIYQISGVTMTGTLVPLNFCDSPRNGPLPPCLAK